MSQCVSDCGKVTSVVVSQISFFHLFPFDEFCLFSSQTAMSADTCGAVRGSPANLREIRARSLILIQRALFVTFEHYFISLVTVIHIVTYPTYIYLLFIE